MVGEAIRRFVERYHVAPSRIVIACSGGVDSTALLMAMADLRSDGFTLVCAHVNHHLRGAESDEDENFVHDLCDRLAVRFVTADGTLPADAIRQAGVEGAARDIRMSRLQSIRTAENADYIATAHQKNDQAETIVMRMLTGTGLAGLRGIHPIREDKVVRPLLDVTRTDLEAFLRDRGISARTDRSNADSRFLRNRVRMALRDLDAAAIDKLAALAADAQSLWPRFERLLDDAEQGMVVSTIDETEFTNWPQDEWLRRALLHRHIRRLDPQSREISARDLERLATSSGSRVQVTPNLELIRERGRVALRRIRVDSEPPRFEVEVAVGTSTYIPEIDATIRLQRGTGDRDAQRFTLPADHATPRFIVRNRRRGDRFQPLGMSQDKKLKDFLIDRKIDAALRDRLPLLIWNDQIVWVAGVEISERFKVTGGADPLYEVMLEHGFPDSERSIQS